MRLGSLVGISKVTRPDCCGGSIRVSPTCQSRIATVRAPGTIRRMPSNNRRRTASLSVRVNVVANAAQSDAIPLLRSLRRRPAETTGGGAQLSPVMRLQAGDFKGDATLPPGRITWEIQRI